MNFANIAGIFGKSIAGIPRDRFLSRPGDNSNHPLWIAGHVVVYRGRVFRILGEEWSA